MLCALDPHFMSILAEYHLIEKTPDDQTQQPSKDKKSELLPDESDEGSAAETSKSEINDFQSKGHRRNPKRKGHANRRGKGKNIALDSESEDENSAVEDDESSVASFKLPSKTQRQTTKHETTKHKGHTKHSTTHGGRKGRDSPFHTSTKSSSSRASRQNILHKRGLKRGRNPHGS